MQNKITSKDHYLCSLLKDQIDKKIKKGNSVYNFEVFNSSQITECPRRILYRSYGFYTEKENNNDLINNHLKYVRNKWVDFLFKCSDIKIKKRNFIAADSHYNVFCEIDAIICIDDKNCVFMVEELDNISYESFNNNGLPRKLIVKMISAMWLSEVDNGIILCDNSKEYFLCHVSMHNSILNSIKSKCRQMFSDKVMQKIPDRPYKDKNNLECNNCEYCIECWK
jgi:hypothetical protein